MLLEPVNAIMTSLLSYLIIVILLLFNIINMS